MTKDDEDVPRVLTLARESYLEVLDATKHQDDKVNRFLVAIAFLTTGTVAFLLRTDVLAVNHIIGDVHIALIAISFTTYLAGTIAAVVLLMLTLSAELRLPGRPERGAWDVSMADSYLYFSMIAAQPVKRWMTHWERPARDLEKDLKVQYARETLNLAERAREKYARTDEAAAIFILALMFLGSGFFLAIDALRRGQAPVEVELGWIPAVLLGAAAGGYSFLLLYNLYRHEQQPADRIWRSVHDSTDPSIQQARRLLGGLRWLMGLTPAIVAVAMALVVIDQDVWRVLAAAVGVALATLALYKGLPGGAFQSTKDRLPSVIFAIGPITAILGIAISGTLDVPVLALISAFGLPLTLSALTLYRQTADVRSLMRRAREATDAELARNLPDLQPKQSVPARHDVDGA